jgi:hypothetical protein
VHDTQLVYITTEALEQPTVPLLLVARLLLPVKPANSSTAIATDLLPKLIRSLEAIPLQYAITPVKCLKAGASSVNSAIPIGHLLEDRLLAEAERRGVLSALFLLGDSTVF